MGKIHKRKIIFSSWILICIILLLRGIDKPVLSPLASELQFVNPFLAAKSENCLAIVDKQRNRLLIGNSRGELTSVTDLTMQGSFADRINCIAIYDDHIYAGVSVHYDSGVYLSSEKIVMLDHTGKFLKEIVRQDYRREEYVSRHRFNSIVVSDNGIQLCIVKNDTVELKNIDESTGEIRGGRSYDIGEPIHLARYLPEMKTLAVMAHSRNFYLIPEDDIIRNLHSELDPRQRMEIISNEKLLKMEYWKKISLSGNFSFTYGSDSTMHYAANVFPETHECAILDIKTGELDSLASMKYSPGFKFRMIWFWLALLSLAVVIVYWTAKAIKKINWKNRDAALYIVGTLVMAIVFYSVFSYNQMRAQYAQNVKTQTRQFSYLLSDILQHQSKPGNISDFLLGTGSDTLLNRIQSLVKQLCNAHGTTYSLYARVGILDDKGYLYPIADSRDIIVPGLHPVELDTNLVLAQDSSSLFRMSGDFADILCHADFIHNAGGDRIGIVVTGCYEDNLKRTAVTNALDMFLKLICIFIALFVSISAIKTFSCDIKRCRSRGKSDSILKAVDLSSILMFVFVLSTFLDYVVVVFVAQNLCADMPLAGQATTVALILAAMNAGCWFGSFIYPKVRTAFSDRSVILCSCVIGFLSVILIIVSISMSSVALFAVGKLAYGFFVLGLMSMIVENLPLYAPEEKSVSLALDSVRNANIAASVLAILAGGYLAEYLSYSMVYVISAGLIAILFLLSMVVFKKNTALSAPARTTTSFTGGWKLFGTSSMLAFSICFVLPRMLAMGYCEYLFPFFSATCGLSALLVSNLKVFSRTICYLFGDFIGSITETIGHNRTLRLSMLAMSVTLFVFLISPSTFWSIAAFFIIDIAYRFTNTPSIMYVRNAALKNDCDSVQAVSNYTTAENAIYIFQSPVLSAFLLLGYNTACVVIGIVCSALTGIFTLFNSKGHSSAGAKPSGQDMDFRKK